MQRFKGHIKGANMSRIRRFTLAGLIAVTAVPAFAQTGTPDQTQPPPQPPPYTTPPPNVNVTVPPATTAQPVVVEPAQPAAQPVVVEEKPVNVNFWETPPKLPIMAVSVGGGVSEFTDSKARDRTGLAGEYEARLLFGISTPLAFEAAYVGTATGLDTLNGGENSATLLSNGVEGMARINFTAAVVQPYIVGGASWVHYSVVNSKVALSDVRSNDDVLAIPFGGGIAAYPGGSFMIDARFVYRLTYDDDLMKPTATNTTGAGLENWNVSLRLGYAF
jgi:hypothetical protein